MFGGVRYAVDDKSSRSELRKETCAGHHRGQADQDLSHVDRVDEDGGVLIKNQGGDVVVDMRRFDVRDDDVRVGCRTGRGALRHSAHWVRRSSR